MSNVLRTVLLSEGAPEKLNDLKNSGVLNRLEPSLTDLEMTIPVGYRHKNNFVHSLEVLRNSINQETNGADIILRTAALFHDIGKPATRKFGKKGVVSFTNHENVGANMVKNILPKHGYSETEINQISVLIRLHMRSHTFKSGWSEAAVRRLLTETGTYEQLKRLIIIFYSDVTTKNVNKKDGIHFFVNQLEVELERVKRKDERNALRPALNGVEVAEILGLTPGPQLGEVMKVLYETENIVLPKDEAIKMIVKRFG